MKKKLLFLISALFVFTLNFGQSNAPKKESKTNKSTTVAVNKTLTKSRQSRLEKNMLKI